MTLDQAGILVGVVAGVGGLVLGILNTAHQWRESTPRLRVRPFVRHLVTRYGGPTIKSDVERNVAGMELSNIGRIPIRGSILGFKGRSKKNAIVVTPTPIDEKPWPGVIEPGESRMIRLDLISAAESVLDQQMTHAIMTSQVGDTFRSSRRDMRRFVTELRRAREPDEEHGLKESSSFPSSTP